MIDSYQLVGMFDAMLEEPLQIGEPDTRTRLLVAAMNVIRAQGYSATSVDQICAAAGVTKGAFFHHFASKEALAVAVANFWSQNADVFFGSAPYHAHPDPLDRVLGYIDFRRGLMNGPVERFTCLVGTMVQEAFAANPAIRDACDASISGHARMLEADIAEAMARYGVTGISPASLALHTQAVLQGGFILAKARSGPEAAIESVAHLKRYFTLLFGRGGADNPQPPGRTEP